MSKTVRPKTARLNATSLIDFGELVKEVTSMALQKFYEEQGSSREPMIIVLVNDTRLIDYRRLAGSLIAHNEIKAVVLEQQIAPVEGGIHYVVLESKLPDLEKGKTQFNLWPYLKG